MPSLLEAEHSLSCPPSRAGRNGSSKWPTAGRGPSAGPATEGFATPPRAGGFVSLGNFLSRTVPLCRGALGGYAMGCEPGYGEGHYDCFNAGQDAAWKVAARRRGSRRPKRCPEMGGEP